MNTYLQPSNCILKNTCRYTQIALIGFSLCLPRVVQAQGTQPYVAIHDSELTRALESMPATGSTPSGAGTTGMQWWPADWHYFVMPESLKEALRSDGTAFAVVGDSNITAGLVLPSGLPKYPIVISLACEAMRDDEIAPLTNYVAAGGFLLVGSSAFTRNPDGTTRGDFAFARELGAQMAAPGLLNWSANNTFTKQTDHRLVSHIPAGQLTWRMPSSAEEIPWGISPSHPFLAPHDVWRVQAGDATVLATGDSSPYLLVKPFGKGYFIYCAAMQPLVGYGGFSPGMYAYVVFRRAIEWAFESARLPVPKLSPWPYAYDAAFVVRHDLENYQNEIANIEASAQFEYAHGARGDYYFCTGTLREEMPGTWNTNDVVAGLRRAVANYGATIGPHNGGLKNPNNPTLVLGDYDYWHWGPDEALEAAPTNYPSGKAYALASLSNSFLDIESWLAGLTNGLRSWVAPYFNAVREDSLDIQAQLGVNTAGEQKLTPFPHWTLSMETPGGRYPLLSLAVSDWYVGGLVAQSMEPWHPPGVHTTATMHNLVDFYYGLGGLLNLYSHTLSTGQGDAGQLAPDYIVYSLDPSLHPRMWSANAAGVYRWWLHRSGAQIAVSQAGSGNESVTSISISGATDPDTSVELLAPDLGSVGGLQVWTNSIPAGGDSYRTSGQLIKLRVGTSVTNAQIRYVLGPKVQGDHYLAIAGSTLTVAAPGVLANDTAPAGGSLTAVLVSGPTHGTLVLNANGGFAYSPASNFSGTDSFTYYASDGAAGSSPATVSILVISADTYFYDDFARATDPGPLAPWVAPMGLWTVTGGVLNGGPDPFQTYGFAYTERWTNYSVQASIQLPAGAYGGGLSGRLDPATGTRYAAWIYPENSTGGSNMLGLVKFQTWTTFGYNNTSFALMQHAALPGVGTGWHTLKLAFHGAQIAVYYDGKQMMSVTDIEAQPYLSGGIGVDMWTDQTPYTMSVDDVVVCPLIVEDSYSVAENSTLTVPASGVLANDTEVYGTNLAAALVTGPANGSLALNRDGGFTYTPAANFSGLDGFTYQAGDGSAILGAATVSISVTPAQSQNTPPRIIGLSTDSQPLILECSSNVGAASNLWVTVSDDQGDALQVVWSLNGTVLCTNQVPATGLPATTRVALPAGLGLPYGPNTIVVSVSDGFFPPVFCTNSVLVLDTSVPMPDLPVLPTLTGECAVVIGTRPTATDNCVGQVLGATSDPLTYFRSGTNIIHWVYSDGHGNSITQAQTVIIKDTTPPVIICPPDVTITNPPLCTYGQGAWHASNGSVGRMLNACFSWVYTNRCVEIGIPGNAGFSLKFTSAAAIQAFLPSGGKPAALNADAVSPGSTSAGVFAGQVLALRLNVDFSDAGLSILGKPDRIGDLVLTGVNSALNGKTVRQALAIANLALGGAKTSSLGISIGDLNDLLDKVNGAYDGGQPSTWAQAHLISAAVSLPFTGTARAIDNCDPNPVVTFTDKVTPGSSPGNYTITRTWRAVDASGNSSTATQCIIVVKAQPALTVLVVEMIAK